MQPIYFCGTLMLGSVFTQVDIPPEYPKVFFKTWFFHLLCSGWRGAVVGVSLKI